MIAMLALNEIGFKVELNSSSFNYAGLCEINLGSSMLKIVVLSGNFTQSSMKSNWMCCALDGDARTGILVVGMAMVECAVHYTFAIVVVITITCLE